MNRMKIRDTYFYKIVKPLVIFIIRFVFRPEVVGVENIPKKGRVVLAGNHTEWLDPVMIVGVQKRQVHFLAKHTLFHFPMNWIVKGMGCVPVNRTIHDKNALHNMDDFLEKEMCIGIFPEGTINRTEESLLPFKIGAVKACHDTKTPLVPFVITGKYKAFKKGLKIEFLKPITIGDNLDKENEKLRNLIMKKKEEENTNE